MKPLRAFFQLLILTFFYTPVFPSPRVGFSLPDSVNEMTIRYRVERNLVVLPVVINDSIKVNLILDTGCRNIVLFGKRFLKLIQHNSDRKIQFSGLGSGKPVHGFLSLGNKISIQEVLGESIPVVVVGSKNVLRFSQDIHGVIGYDIFLKFEIELNPREQTITFRPAQRANAPEGYNTVPLKIVDSRPIMNSEIVLNNSKNNNGKYALMIDTGSSLGLLLKTATIDEFETPYKKIIGIGFNGPISGFNTISDQLSLDGFNIKNLPTGIIQSAWHKHNYASIGMEILKDYILVLNYCKAYACFKPLDS